jgi:hypothetical protein
VKNLLQPALTNSLVVKAVIAKIAANAVIGTILVI